MWNKWLLLLVVLLLLLPFAVLMALSFFARRPSDLGVKDGRLAPCPDTPNCVCSQATDPDHRIEPLRFKGSAADAKIRLKQALATLPRSAIITETEDYLHVECTSLIFRFVDDVEFWIDEPRQVIHLRSASRVGRSDLGVNRQRMETVRQAFAQ